MSSSSLQPPVVGGSARRLGRLSWHATGRFTALISAGFLFLLGAFWQPRLVAAALIWDIVMVAIWLLDLARLPRANSWHVERRWLGFPQLLRSTTVEIEATNTSAATLTLRCIDSASPDLVREVPRLRMAVSPKSSMIAAYAVEPRERGPSKIGPVYLQYLSRIGLAAKWAVAELSQDVIVLPDVKTAEERALQLIRTQQVQEARRQFRMPGPGREFETLREYREGDELRNISWSATARRRQLITRTFTAERSQTVWLLVDAGRLLRARVQLEDGDRTVSKLDSAVNAALAVAQIASRSGDSVGLLTYGRNIQQLVTPGRGSEHMRRLVDALARTHTERVEASHGRATRALLRRQTRRCLVLWLTDFAETASTPEVVEHAGFLARRHLVLIGAVGHPDLAAVANATPESATALFRHAAAREVLQRRALLLRKLRDSGALALELTPERATTVLINEYLRVRNRSSA